jgi:hypothetical protein
VRGKTVAACTHGEQQRTTLKEVECACGSKIEANASEACGGWGGASAAHASIEVSDRGKCVGASVL